MGLGWEMPELRPHPRGRELRLRNSTHNWGKLSRYKNLQANTGLTLASREFLAATREVDEVSSAEWREVKREQLGEETAEAGQRPHASAPCDGRNGRSPLCSSPATAASQGQVSPGGSREYIFVRRPVSRNRREHANATEPTPPGGGLHERHRSPETRGGNGLAVA